MEHICCVNQNPDETSLNMECLQPSNEICGSDFEISMSCSPLDQRLQHFNLKCFQVSLQCIQVHVKTRGLQLEKKTQSSVSSEVVTRNQSEINQWKNDCTAAVSQSQQRHLT